MTAEDRQRLVAVAPHFGVRLLRSTEPEGPAGAPEPQTPRSLDVSRSRFQVLARLGTADENLVLMRGVIEPGRDLSIGDHVDQTTVFVIEGALNVRHETLASTRLLPGDALHVASGAARAARNVGDTAARILLVSTVRAVRQRFGAAQP